MKASDYYDLGSYRRDVKCRNEEARRWFDRGLIWAYAFNHEESAKCFERAIAADETFAMAHWGLAYTLGPNYNKPWEFFDSGELGDIVGRTHNAVLRAQQTVDGESAVEVALIRALKFRYPSENATDAAECSCWNREYANAMADVYRKFPTDLDVAALYADALMNLTPWALWDIKTGAPTPDAKTLEVKAVLDTALEGRGGNSHPGLLHLYIHLMEMSESPESALPIANRLRGLVPDAGHLQHMPSHLDVLCGHWTQAIESNSDAIMADEKHLARNGPTNFYTLYRSHNYHFKIYSAMFAGQHAVAMETVAQMESSMPDALLRTPSPPMADWLEGFLAMRVHVLVRFGNWTEILELNLPRDQTLYCTTTAMIHYGCAIAHANAHAPYEAEISRELFQEAVQKVPSSRTLFNNTCVDILGVASAMLDGEVEFRRGNVDLGLKHLREAIRLSDSLPYDEPWGWMHPPRHVYGALLLELADQLGKDDPRAIAQVEEAATVYAADLGISNALPRALQHPKNVWALAGYSECMERLDRPNNAESEIANAQLQLAKLDADVPIPSSCFCRKLGVRSRT